MAIVTRNTARTVDHLHSSLWCPSGLSRFSPAISRDAPPGMPAKPHPAALESIAREWGVPLDEGLLMVGDSPANDVGFGRAAGVSTALLDTGRRHVEGGSDGGADLVVDALGRLPHLLFRHFEIDSPAAGPLKKYAPPTPGSSASRAARAGDVDALRAMAPYEVDAPDDENGNTPLIWAADAGHAHAVKALLDMGVTSLNHRGFLGATACARACRAGHIAVLEALLAAPGCDPNLANDKMQAPLHFAAFKLQPRAVSLMLQHAACNPFVLDRKGRTPAEDTSDDAIRAQIIAAQQEVLDGVPRGEMQV